LTNNHVIADSTKIAVTVATTGKTYTASVVGSDSTEDVAVLQLKDAEDLQPATIDDDTVDVGDDVTAVGNSEGSGRLMAAEGTVTDLGASVTTTAKGTEDSETLDDMIQVQADIVSGDSGGALLDDEGEVVGMDTAASSGTAVVTGFAIPIETALTTAESIIDGEQTSTNTLGYPAFLGIGVNGQSGQSGQPGQSGQSGQPGAAATEGAVVAGVYEDTPAAAAGLAAGDTITAIGSTPITDRSSRSDARSDHEPGDTAALTWTDANGQSHTTEVTLTQGRAAWIRSRVAVTARTRRRIGPCPDTTTPRRRSGHPTPAIQVPAENGPAEHASTGRRFCATSPSPWPCWPECGRCSMSACPPSTCCRPISRPPASGASASSSSSTHSSPPPRFPSPSWPSPVG